ncbi:gamma subclass chorismate mutase AroQ [Zavarzinella formosa]|uniref:gamma subclass chorismate mutase AroQ n=1 Tax=Zavarzinella formosa TaxID=360055 RepID=UPI00031C212A|nr:gamma subclass chorismate mutase AroQ [Zavarzinella formosa]
MKHQRIWIGVLVLCFGCQSSPTTPPDTLAASVDETLTLMNDRLGLMNAVAESKLQLNLPVEDASREEAILQAVEVDAKAAGLDKAFAREFFTAQFEAAKLIQAEAKKSLPKTAPSEEGMKKAGEKLTELRTKINDLNIKLLTTLGKIDWKARDTDARKRFAERGPELLKTHPETVRAKALAPLLSK